MNEVDTVKYWKLRDKEKLTFLTKGDIDPNCDDEVAQEIATFGQEESAHEARFKYEKDFESYDIHVEVEVVGFDEDNSEVNVE